MKKNNTMTAIIVAVLSAFLALTVGATLLLITWEDIFSNNDTETESHKREDETLPPPMDLADERHLSFIKTSDDSAYTVLGLLGEVGAINIVIPETYNKLPVIGIENEAFASSTDLVSLTMPDTIKYIGQSAFEGCNNLESINISPNLEYIGDFAFDGCDALEFTEYDNALYFGSEEYPYTILMKAKDTDIESCTVHQNTKIIYSGAFYDCTELSTIAIPDGICQIGIAAFDECYDLFPNPKADDPHYAYTKDAYYLGNDSNPFLVLVKARAGKELTSITVHNDTKIIAPGAFVECDKLESISFPDKLEIIGEYAFEGCKALNTINVGHGISWRVFMLNAVYQNGITSATISESFATALTEKYYHCAWIKQ